MTLSEGAFTQLSLRQGWPQEACALATRIRTSPPARLVQGRKHNVTGRYPSRKMGRTIQFESHTCELPVILDMEYNQADLLEYWDQPIALRLEYQNKKGRQVSVSHVPDFFVIRQAHAEFIECKTEEALVRLVRDQPGRYQLSADGRWRCPPGERACSSLGFRYSLASTAEIDRTHIRNTLFLEDYLGADTPPVAAQWLQQIKQIIANASELSLAELLERALAAGATANDVYTLIATGEVFVNLSAAPLIERERVAVYLEQRAAPPSPAKRAAGLPRGQFVELREGARISFGADLFRIALVSNQKVYLEGADGTAPIFSLAHFEQLVSRGEVQAVAVEPEIEGDARWKAILDNAQPNRKTEANRRYALLKCLFGGEPLPEAVAPRTLARWKARFRSAERQYGQGLVGLLPDYDRRGDRKTVRLPAETKALMVELIETDYETNVQKGMAAVWSKVVLQCQERHLPAPSYQTFTRDIKRRPVYQQARQRTGHRAAYAKQPFYYWLEKDTPRHGDRPFEVCHIDHTELDLELVDPYLGAPLGRPWATLMMDAYSRRVMAVYVSFERPSYRAAMMVVRECVRRTTRLPQTLVVDGGLELHSIYFETLAAAFEITIKTRPGAEPRFGSVVERLFNTTNSQFVHNLQGNTQITKNVRQITRGNAPQRLAVWSLGPFYESLCEWAYQQYDTEPHWTLKQSPREAAAAAVRLTGERQHRQIVYDEGFKLLTLPTTRKGTAKNFDGKVKISNRWYWCDELSGPEFAGAQLPVRYDPFNLGVAYVYLGGRWVECVCDHYLALQGRTEKEQQIISAEARRRDQLFPQDRSRRARERARQFTAHEQRQQEQSEKLRLVRRQQRENEAVLKVINGSGAGGAAPARPSDTTAATAGSHDPGGREPKSLFAGVDAKVCTALAEYQG